MNVRNVTPLVAAFVLAISATWTARAIAADTTPAANTHFKFSFGPGAVPDGYTQVQPTTAYSKDRGYGFDLGTQPTGVDDGGTDALHGHYVTSTRPFAFSVAVPEGNYKVTLTLGDPKGTSLTTVYAESRRLMLERIATESGKFATRSFTVNVRTAVISPGVSVDIDSREINSLTWDDKLTLQFCDTRPCLCAMEITKVDDAITVFVGGDSTVTDQPNGGIGTWAQFLPRWFGPGVAVANHAESGETLKAFRTERRWDKILSQLKKGDYVMMQFGTNDSKATGNNPIYPASHPDSNFANTYSPANTDFRTLYEKYAAETQAKGANFVVVSLMARRNMTNGKIANSFGDYPKAAATAAAEAKCGFVDLNTMSTDVFNALGPDLVGRAFSDGTHPSNYGGYVLSRCVVEGIKSGKLDLAKYLVDDTGTFDVNHPVPMPDDFKVPVDLSGGGAGAARGGARAPRGAGAPPATMPGN